MIKWYVDQTISPGNIEMEPKVSCIYVIILFMWTTDVFIFLIHSHQHSHQELKDFMRTKNKLILEQNYIASLNRKILSAKKLSS